MLASLRQASRLLSQPAQLCRRALSTHCEQLSLQQFSLRSLLGLQQAEAASLASPAPALWGPQGGLPPAAAASLQQHRLQGPALLPELGEIIGGLEGKPRGQHIG